MNENINQFNFSILTIGVMIDEESMFSVLKTTFTKKHEPL